MSGGGSGVGGIRAGARRGGGGVTARVLGLEGARVLLVARREDALAEAARSCAADGGEAAALALDVTEPDAGERALAAGEEHLGAVPARLHHPGPRTAPGLPPLTDRRWRAPRGR